MNTTERELATRFEAIRSSLEQWGAFVDDKINELISAEFRETNFIQMRPVHRCKDVTSFIRKVLYRDKNNNYPDPLTDVEDKVATRVVLLTSANVATVKALLIGCESWDYKISKDTKEISKLYPNLFDYQSVHLVVWPKENFGQTDKLVLTCEIQIRTLLDHAYAEVTHDSIYKGPYQNNNAVRRQLSKCMALMETTDDMFCNVFDRISIQSESELNEYKTLLFELAVLYSALSDRSVNFKKSDVYFLDAVLSLYRQRPVSIESLVEVVNEQEDAIRLALLKNESVLMQEPIVVLLFYYVESHYPFVAEQWPLSMHIIDSMREALGLAEPSY